MDILQTVIPLLAILIVFWLLMVLPQQKAHKKRQAMLDGLKSGDKIETIGRIFGKIVHVMGDELVVDISANDKKHEITIHKEGVARLLPGNIIGESSESESK